MLLFSFTIFDYLAWSLTNLAPAIRPQLKQQYASTVLVACKLSITQLHPPAHGFDAVRLVLTSGWTRILPEARLSEALFTDASVA
jgi:hypothetical protein